MADFQDLKQAARITDFIDGGKLKKVASTGGGELAGPCPFCGGSDRFRVQPANNIWLCRHCTAGKWRDVIDFIAKRDNLSIGQAANSLRGSFPELSGKHGKQENTPPPRPAYAPPPKAWQLDAREAVHACRDNLYSEAGARALAYLEKRGFMRSTLERFKIGYSDGYQSGTLYVPKGITIPAEISGALWYLKIRTNTTPKYTLVKGSKPAALFAADDLLKATNCLIVEGEFNAMIAWQEFGDLLPAASMGSASNRIDLAVWGWYFMNMQTVLAVYDNDLAGDAGALALYEHLGDRVKLAALPDKHDLNSYHQAGKSLMEWANSYLQFYTNN